MIERIRVFFRDNWLPVLGALAIVIAVLTVYMPVLGGKFLPWDDDYNISNNYYFTVGPWYRLLWTPHYGMYIPVVSALWATLWAIGDGDPAPFRAFNMIMHLGNVALVAVITDAFLKRMHERPLGRSSLVAVFGASVVYALHPFQVGAVGWISGSRDLLSTFFALLAAIVFLVRPYTWKTTLLSTAFFSLGLLCKPAIVVIPAVLWSWTFLFEKEKLKLNTLRLVPWFAASLAATLVTWANQVQAIERPAPLWMRPWVAADAYGFYLLKLVWPQGLTVDYGRIPGRLLQDPSMTIPTLTALAVTLALLTGASIRYRGARVGWLWFLALLPVSGIVSFAFQEISTVADHYNYVPLVIPCLLFALLISKLLPPNSSRSRLAIASAVIALGVLPLSLVSAERAQTWSNEVTFFEKMAERNPRSYSAAIGLGGRLCEAKATVHQGLFWILRAKDIKPSDPVSTANLAACLFRMGRIPEILALENDLKDLTLLRRFSQHDVAWASFLSTMGSAAAQSNQIEKGLRYLCLSTQVNPYDQRSQKNLGLIMAHAKVPPGQGCGSKLDPFAFAERETKP